MEDTKKNSSPIEVEGYAFYTEQDAELAKSERKKIDYLRERIDYNNPDMVLRVYEKAVADRVFRTPVGIDFLKELREFLAKIPDFDMSTVSPIPLPLNFENEVRSHSSPAKERVKPAVRKNVLMQRLRISVLLNILLVIAVIVMFVIAIKSDQPNVLNYERAITNRYAGWEQELTEREQKVREKERELDLSR